MWNMRVRLSLCGAIAGHAIAVCLGASTESADLIGRAVKPRLSSRGYKALLHLECSVPYLSTCLT